jgi:hypothetical protein
VHPSSAFHRNFTFHSDFSFASTATAANMEVFLSNLPRDLTEQGLEAHLTPFVNSLNIIDWTCRKTRMRTHGHITFLTVADAEKFLRQHEELDTGQYNQRGQRRTRARLNILNTQVYCQRSRAQPDPFLLRNLKKTADDRREAEP